jgi:23S rRNA G2069 N7-methylase RlmK/C1962 C5-methylase RlmI
MESGADKVERRVEMLVNRARKNRRRLKAWREREGITCYRLYDRDVPEIPLAVDWYEGRLHVAAFEGRYLPPDDEGRAQAGQLASALAGALGVRGESVFVKVRRRQPGGAQYARLSARRELIEVGEHGLRFLVNLADRIDTGLFLDHRPTRCTVRDLARGRRVLNLFGYTGTFSVYAAAGGASETTTLDLSNTYLDWARANMRLNGFTGPCHRFVRGDAMRFLEQTRPGSGVEFDLVVVDPPTVSKSKKMRRDFDVQRDHTWLLGRTLELCSAGAVVYFSTNFRRFKMSADRIRAAEVEEVTEQTIPPDFRDRRIHRCWRIIAR